MKTKLLKKVRRRFEIILYPKGYMFGGDLLYPKGCVLMVDRDNGWNNYSYPLSQFSEEGGFERARQRILHIVREQYTKSKPEKLPAIKLWYNG